MLRIAENAGFCFGVKRATNLLEKALDEKAENEKVYTLGHIIHNELYLEHLRKKGANELKYEDLPDIMEKIKAGDKIKIVIRAHGEKNEIIESLRETEKTCPNFSLLDGTCPYVEKVRSIAKENSGDGRFFILIGAKEHPEAEGIMSCCAGEGIVIKDEKELCQFLESEKGREICQKTVSLAAQTTQNISEWKKCCKKLKKVCTNAFIFDTICNVTEKRQNEAMALAQTSDTMIVIGSKISSNTKKLCEVSSSLCRNVILIENPDEVNNISLPSGSIVSITAGASTPSSVIQEVCKKMEEQMNGNFAELVEASIKTLNTGEVVEGIVSSVAPNELHLDLGAKATGIVEFEKATTDPSAKLADLYHVGDVVKAKVIKVSDIDGLATLDITRVTADQNWYNLVDAEKAGEILEGKVTEAVKGGVIITIDGVKIFVPASQTGIPRDGDITTLVGTTQKIKIIDIKADRKKATGSIKAVLSAERRAKVAAFWYSIEVGQEFDGEVKNITSYGAFVDLGGVDGMVHKSELSWSRVGNPADYVSVGETLHVFVKELNKEKRKISLGYKTEDTNPWVIFRGKYNVDDEAEVKIVNLMPFGAFAEIVPGVDGLIHISQITDHKIAKPGDELEIGQVVTAKITAIDEENHKVNLSIRALMDIPEEVPAEEAAEEDAAPIEYSTDKTYEEQMGAVEEAVEAVAEEAAPAEEAEETPAE